ncbi:MAG: sigma-70 family RNA polymerase sigma factor [Myxococcales bacterium]|nr:sigma-70 family RNA polymerase sigma factor [Myxococcales bacterium]
MALASTQPTTRPGADPVSGDRAAAWAALYERHFDDVYRLVRRAGVSAAEAEDVTQRTFLRVHALLAHTPEVVHPLAWLRAITVRVVSEHHRFWRLRRMKRWVVEGAALLARVATPAEHFATHQAQDQVADVLTRMSPKLRAVLVLAELEELAPSEVAAILGIPVNTVRSRRTLARAQFTELWQRRHGGAP